MSDVGVRVLGESALGLRVRSKRVLLTASYGNARLGSGQVPGR